MKKLLYVLVPVMLMVSCKSEQEKTQEMVVEHVRSTMKNPESFILDSVVGPDTTYLSKLMDIKHTLMVTNANMMADAALEKTKYNFLYSYTEKMDAINEARKEYEKCNEFKEKMEQTKGGLNDTVVAYSYKVYCRGTNSFNAVVKDEVTIYVKPNGVILKEGVDELIELMNNL
jgi:hypothetical protein